MSTSTETIELSGVIPASPNRIYHAWLNAREHSAFTGGRATVDSSIGGRYTAWDGYIEGRNIALEPGRRIVQTWRTREFPMGSADSRLEVVLEPVPGGTRVHVIHTGIPEGQSEKYRSNWKDFYLKPMKRYFMKLSDPSLSPRAVAEEALERNAPALQAVVSESMIPPPPRRAASDVPSRPDRARKPQANGRGRVAVRAAPKRAARSKPVRARSKTKSKRR